MLDCAMDEFLTVFQQFVFLFFGLFGLKAACARLIFLGFVWLARQLSARSGLQKWLAAQV